MSWSNTFQIIFLIIVITFCIGALVNAWKNR